jgi:murein DD-endopeptidase MepM/ murein hydrolase activator NlpD
MLCIERSRQALAAALTGGRIASIAAVAALATGCSADVARFDSPAFGLTEGGINPTNPTPSEPVRRGGTSAPIMDEAPGPAGSAYPPSASTRQAQQSTRMSPLPESAPAPSAGNGSSVVAALPPAKAPIAQPAAAPAAPQPKGEAVEVNQGDTLYGLAKRHHVSVAELMAVNELKSPHLKPGQKLYLPAGRTASKKPLPRPAAPAPAAAGWNGSYTIRSGDSIYGIARQHKVTAAELQRTNGITDPHKLKPGMVLRVPGTGAAVAAAPSVPAAPAEAPRVVQSATRPSIVNSAPKQVAALEPAARASDAQGTAEPAKPKGTEVAAASPAAMPAGKFRWPVKGRILAGFGARPDGTHNDGVNLAVPLGTEVHAAEAGVVAYAGSELKGYGNLILLRHDNGWVTAYAHNDEVLVKRGDKVRRGQVISKAGKTGTVDQPQLHFELRQGSKPVDPTPHMERK